MKSHHNNRCPRECPRTPTLDLDKIKKVNVQGAKNFEISVKVTGNPQGQPIVFIHGYSESWLIWNFQLNSAKLLDKFRLIAIDMRGQGESQPKSFNADDYIAGSLYAEDIDTVFKSLNIKNAIVVAHSLGGTWLADYIKNFGTENIKGILFIAAPIDINTPIASTLLTKEFIDDIPLLTDSCLQITSRGISRFLSLLFNCEIPRKNAEEILSYVSLVPSQIRRNLLLHEPLSAKEVLPNVQTPILILDSRADRVVRFQASERINRIAPNSKIILFEEIGHTIFAEIPNTFNTILCEFANSL